MKIEITRKKCYDKEKEFKGDNDVSTPKESTECTIKKCLKEGEVSVEDNAQLTVLFL